MLAIFKRELRSCFHGMIGAVLTAFMLAATAIYFVALNLGYCHLVARCLLTRTLRMGYRNESRT